MLRYIQNRGRIIPRRYARRGFVSLEQQSSMSTFTDATHFNPWKVCRFLMPQVVSSSRHLWNNNFGWAFSTNLEFNETISITEIFSKIDSLTINDTMPSFAESVLFPSISNTGVIFKSPKRFIAFKSSKRNIALKSIGRKVAFKSPARKLVFKSPKRIDP